MADLALHRADGTPSALGLGLAVNLVQCGELGHVTGLGSRAVGFQHTDRLGWCARLLISASQRPSLPTGHRRVDRLGPTIARCPHTAQHGIDTIAISLRIGEALQDHHAHTFSEDRAITLSTKGSAITRRRQGRGLGEAHVHEDIVQGIHATAQHHVGSACLQLHKGHVKGAKATRTGRVDDAVRAAEVEPVGDPPGHDVAKQPREGALLPTDITLGDASDHILTGLSIDTGLFQGPPPTGMPQSGAEVDHQLLGPGHAENHGGSGAIPGHPLTVTGILEGLAGHHQRQ